MRITTLFRKLLTVTQMFVEDFTLSPIGLTLSVRPTWRVPRCGVCGKKATQYDRQNRRRWRSLGLGSLRIWLAYSPRRVDCPTCGVRVEAVPWATHKSNFTKDFEELTAYLAQCTDKTTVTKLMGISWNTVGAIVERVVERNLDPERLSKLRHIGIDEFSYRKHHNYITIVVDHDERRVVWAGPGKNAKALEGFFEELGDAAADLEVVSIDMSRAYIKVVEERAPQASIVFDRFHLHQMVSEALDEIRREQLRDLRGTEQGRKIYKSRYALLKNPWNLTQREDEKLSELQKTNKKLYRAYLLKETLSESLDCKQPRMAERALKGWLIWATRSRLKPFVKLARTVRKHFDGILAYVKYRLTNGLVEGMNNRIRVIANRAFGFHSAEALISMIFLCCSGITLEPPLPGTHRW